MVSGLPTFCVDCGTKLRPDNQRDHCAECAWHRRNDRLLAIDRERQRQRRRQAVAERLARLPENDGRS
jgi:hypothetical protein